MRKVIVMLLVALCASQLCKAQEETPLQGESKICIMFDFTQAKKINKLPYAYYEEDPTVLKGFAKGVIGFFNARSKTLKSSLAQENTGEKFDLVFVVEKVDSDGETEGTLMLKEHATGNIIASRKGMNVDGGSGRSFEDKWNAACEKLAKRFVSFTKKFTGEKMPQKNSPSSDSL